jgi:hypothetical protein
LPIDFLKSDLFLGRLRPLRITGFSEKLERKYPKSGKPQSGGAVLFMFEHSTERGF